MDKKAKLAEIEAIRFDFLHRVPQWHVKQGIMLQLARACDVETNTLRVDAGDIRITAELIGNVFSIPSRGDPIPELQKKNASHLAIKREFQKKTTTQLRDFVFACPMETEQQRMTFRRYFILVVLKMFLNPTSQQTISPWHLPPILDVSNPRRFYWPYQILKWLRDAIRKFQDENRETCGGCMFMLLRLKHGLLHACQVPEPWIVEWTTNELDKKADHVISQGCIVKNARKGKKNRRNSLLIKQLTRKEGVKGPARTLTNLRLPKARLHLNQDIRRRISYKIGKLLQYVVACVARSTMEENSTARTPTSRHLLGAGQNLSIGISIRRRLGTRRKLPIRRSRSRSGTKKAIPREIVPGSNGAPLVVPDSDDEDDVPLARRIRLFQQQAPPQDVKQAEPMFKDNYKGPKEENTDHKDISPHTPPTAHVQLSDYDFDREFDISIVQYPEFEQESVTRNDSLASFIDGVRPIYAGLSPSFGEDTRFFDKVVAAKRKWWFFPNCWRGHLWVYAFEVNAKRLVILDSLHSAPKDDERDKLDAYVGRLYEDIASIVIPAFIRTTYGPSRSYTKDSLRSYRMELMLDIICGPHNKREVSSPFTAPSTRSLIERAEGLPKGAMRKGRKKLLT
ncbi:uncharacterized protein DS421_16g551580 [Arachis hypogaea]|nr:uncharacterized protein DS421_16g551580 [Arachis hypogaea]